MGDTDTDLPTPGSKNVTLCATLGRPFARGTIHIASTDPLAQPKIDPHVFEEEWGTSLTLTAANSSNVRKIAQTCISNGRVSLTVQAFRLNAIRKD